MTPMPAQSMILLSPETLLDFVKRGSHVALLMTPAGVLKIWSFDPISLAMTAPSYVGTSLVTLEGGTTELGRAVGH